MTALHFAARAGHLGVVDVLLRYHADVNALDHRGTSALMEACHGGPWKLEPAEDIIQRLLDNGAQVDLFQAAAMGRTSLIASILDRDVSAIDTRDAQGKTALFHAAHNNRLAVVKLLVERGADVNRSDAVGTAALHRTSGQCSDELIRYLIDHGADAHLCCYVACGDEAGTREALARTPMQSTRSCTSTTLWDTRYIVGRWARSASCSSTAAACPKRINSTSSGSPTTTRRLLHELMATQDQ